MRFLYCNSAAIILATVGVSPTASRDSTELNLRDFNRVDQLIEEAIDEGHIPGAVLLVGQRDNILYRKAYGYRALKPNKVPMTPEVIFDLASLTKPVACATSIMLLSERGQLSLSDKVSKYIGEFAANGKEDITIEQLLLHRAGLIADNPLDDYRNGPAQALANIYALSPKHPPGKKFIYSDVGYIVLGELVRVVSSRSLDIFAAEEIFEPLGMKTTAFNPPAAWKKLCTPTEQRNGRWMIGEVHDPRAFLLGGVAGHAGLFGTADDLARWCRMILGGGRYDGKRILSEATVRLMTQSRCLENGTDCRGYGFDIDTKYSSARGDLFEAGTTFGHTGYTGTSFWMAPKHNCYLILLTNRVHPDGTGQIIDLRRQVATAVAEVIIK